MTRILRGLTHVALPCAALLLVLPGRFARAEDSQEEVMKKLREQVQKIISLMKENEQALLVASTGGASTPGKPEVEIPDQPPGGSAAGGAGAGDPAAGDPAEELRKKGEEAARRLRELVEKQKSGAQKIPREIEEFIRMIPQQEGGGGQGGDPKDGQPQPKPEDPRDARKRLEEEERKKQEEARKKAEKEPGDPKDRANVDPLEDRSGSGARDPSTPAWVTGLPTEWRDAFTGGKQDHIPAQWRDMVIRYIRWLSSQPEARTR